MCINERISKQHKWIELKWRHGCHLSVTSHQISFVLVFKFDTYVTRTFPCRLMVDKPCSVPRARLMTCCWGFGVTTGVDLAGCFLFVVALRRTGAGALLWWWFCWACLNLWLPAVATAPDWTRCCDLAATEQSFDWFDSLQSVRALASLLLVLRPTSTVLRDTEMIEKHTNEHVGQEFVGKTVLPSFVYVPLLLFLWVGLFDGFMCDWCW